MEPSLEDLHARIAELAAAGSIDEAAELAAANWRRWLAAGEIEAGRAALAPVLSGGHADSRNRALTLYGDGLFLFRLGDQEASRGRNEDALAMARRLGDAEVESFALVGLSRVAFRDGAYSDVIRLAAEARNRVPADGGVTALAALHMHAAGCRLLPDYEQAAVLYRESLALAASLGDARMVAMEQHNLGHVELHRGNVDEAEQLFEQRLAYAAGSPDPYEHAMTALNDAALAVVRRKDGLARMRLAHAKRLLAENGIVLDPDDQFELDAVEILLG